MELWLFIAIFLIPIVALYIIVASITLYVIPPIKKEYLTWKLYRKQQRQSSEP
jgi:uncharacterized protein HemY